MALRAFRKLVKAVEVARDESDGENGVENDEDFTMADEDKIMTHMMDCLALLAAVQKEQQKDIPVNPADARVVRNKVFVEALSMVGNSLLRIGDKEQPKRTTHAAVDQLLEAFSFPSSRYNVENECTGWLPLHWAVALLPLQECNVTETDVNTLYDLDPMAMQMKHVDKDDMDGFTPAHLLCMSPVTPCGMELIRLLSLCSPAAFGSTTVASALHVACRYGTPSVELLQHLLQLDSSQTKVEQCFNNDYYEHRPLGQLCFNLVERADELPNAEDLV